MSTYYSNGTIVIPKVTGDITISVVAVENAPTFTNLANKASEEWLTGKRINSSNAIVDAAGWDITNFVACSKNDTLRYKNINITSAIAGSNNGRVAIYTDKNTCVATCNPHSQTQFFSTGTDGTTTFNVLAYINSIKGAVPAAENTAYIRLVCVSNPTNPIITVNEEIEGGGGKYINLADPNNAEWKTGYRISSVGIEPQTGKTVSNPITVAQNDVIRVKGVNFQNNSDRYQYSFATDRVETGRGTIQQYISTLPDTTLDFTVNGDVYVFTVKSDHPDAALCFSFNTPTDPSAIIITRNEEI